MLTSSILNSLHVTLDYFSVINIGGILILLVLAIITLGKLINMKRRYKKFTTGESGYNLEKIVLEQRDEIREMKKIIAEHDDYIATISTHFSHLYSKVYIMKYDAFQEVRANMSFVLVMLDMKNNGIMINSIRGTSGNYVYLKEIKDGKSEIPLCKEEEIALKETVRQSV